MRGNRFLAALTLALLCAIPAGPAAAHTPPIAEPIVSGLSQDRIRITSTYTGTDLVIFGAVEAPLAQDEPDIAVLVRGPSENMMVRRKSRVAGIWLNTDKASFRDMPSFYFAAATRPLDEVAPPGTLVRYGLGFAALRALSGRPAPETEPYRRALIRRLSATKMYTEEDGGVDMLSPRLFRLHVPLPAEAARGRYLVEVFLFRDGALIGHQKTPFFVDQIGIERKIEVFSRKRPLAYGLTVLAMAWLIGWAATLVAKKR